MPQPGPLGETSQLIDDLGLRASPHPQRKTMMNTQDLSRFQHVVGGLEQRLDQKEILVRGILDHLGLADVELADDLE